MGIKDLNKLIKKYSPPTSIRSISNYEELRGKKLAIDAFEMLYKFKSISEDQSVFLGLLHNFSKKFLNLDIEAIFVIDGKPMEEKHAARDERQKRFNANTKRLETKISEIDDLLREKKIINESISKQKPNEPDIEVDKPKSPDTPAINDDSNIIDGNNINGDDNINDTINDINKKIDENTKIISTIKRQLIRINNDDIEKSCEMWKLMGFTIGKSNHEGEAGCAKLAKDGIVDYAVSNDTDTLCFEDDINILRNITMSGGQPIQCLNSKTIREDFGMEREQFIELCILCGCDFSKKLVRLAALGAYNVIKEYGTIDAVVRSGKYKIPECGWTPDDAKYVFMEKECEVLLEEGEKDDVGLKEFLTRNNINQ